MIDDDEDVTSVDQDNWVALSNGIMRQLAKIIPKLSSIKDADAIETLVDTCETAMRIHKYAITFDKWYELMMAETSLD